MIDTTSPFSPGWWFARLAADLLDRRPRYDALQDYADNAQELQAWEVARSTKAAYQRLRRLSRTNFAELVVEATRERMTPVGFRTGVDGNADTDKEAWRIWQANSLDADSALVHRTCLTLGDAYAIIGPVDDYIGAPTITPEDPREVIVEHDPVVRRRPRAALKMFTDNLFGDVAYVYLPGAVYRARRDPRISSPVTAFFATEWTFDEMPGGGLASTRVPDGVVPVVRFTNKPDLWGVGVGEFEVHTPLLDRINYQVLQRLEVATLQAFRQRAVKGLPSEDEDGNEIDYTDMFTADPGALWLLPEAAELWESGQVDLGPIRQAIRDDVGDLAAVTRTPLYYLSPDATNGSAEGASLAREGLVFKVEDRIKQAGESWERVISTAFRMAGGEPGRLADTEVLWAPTERFSLAERYDAATKAQSAGVPFRVIMSSILQFSPQEVDRMQAERISDALFSTVALPIAAQTTASPAPAPAELNPAG